MYWQDRYQPRHEPERTLRLMTASDIPAAADLSEHIGWDTAIPEWERLLFWSPEGCFVVEEAERGLIGTVTTTPYGTALGWIGKLIVAPDRQRQGLGHQLMRAALDYLIAHDVERIMLDATDAGRQLYEQLGFRPLETIHRWEGRASTYLGPRARRLAPADVPAVLDLDRQLFGLDRRHILERLLGEFPDLAWVDATRDGPQGYLLGRRTGRGIYLGPWMSRSPDAAERLLLVALEQLQGQPLTLNIPNQNGRALILAGDHNLRRVRRCTRMIYGSAAPPAGELLAEYAIASLATG